MNRATRRSKNSVNQVLDNVVIAGLRVTINSKLPDGVMLVSENEGKRLAKLVADATAKQMSQDNETQEEGK